MNYQDAQLALIKRESNCSLSQPDVHGWLHDTVLQLAAASMQALRYPNCKCCVIWLVLSLAWTCTIPGGDNLYPDRWLLKRTQCNVSTAAAFAGSGELSAAAALLLLPLLQTLPPSSYMPTTHGLSSSQNFEPLPTMPSQQSTEL